MELEKTTRDLNAVETRQLKHLRALIERELKRKVKFQYFTWAALFGVLFTYLAVLSANSFWVLPAGTLALICFCYIIFIPYDLVKERKRLKKRIVETDYFLQKNQVGVIPIEALRIAVAKEYEDEGDLFIVEHKPGYVLYLWDADYNLRKNFPCRQFEIYEPAYTLLTGRLLHALTEKTEPVVIDKNAKWAYMKSAGAPEHLTTEHTGFDAIVDGYNRFLK